MTEYPVELERIAKDHSDATFRALSLAFEAGRTLGRAEGRTLALQELVEFAGRGMGEVSSPTPPELTSKKASPASDRSSAGEVTIPPRAPKGSVRPAIMAAIDRAGHTGASPEDILELVHKAGHRLIKPETIRTTLHKLAVLGNITKHNGLWIISEPRRSLLDEEPFDDTLPP